MTTEGQLQPITHLGGWPTSSRGGFTIWTTNEDTNGINRKPG
jgi:hypothetical protein